ncbi:hypothetical protein CONLIGDRAFT_613586 [Coniochaeta ligniaria NRRL 30616]|uniref:Zn(2)-C6 fungal-type domain-containing protein n=1 Tax=Coniochaeta ligniaria NRRL 30616 TaxID=1408157 RepID=A0A1J7ITC8_9PEZI|nr:hypothetical protein CONLIGDRAFT_613586 [Coniochaeta ligniaria NRRL 30616]
MAASFDYTGESPDSRDSASVDTQQYARKKQRISRACDICHQRRVKCDGNVPCSRCADSAACTFLRGTRKRGKPPRNGHIGRRPSHDSQSAEDSQLQEALPGFASVDQIHNADSFVRDQQEHRHEPTNGRHAQGAARFESSGFGIAVANSNGRQAGMVDRDFVAFAPPDLHVENASPNVLSDAFPNRPVNQHPVDWGSFASNTATAHARLSTDQESQAPHTFEYPVLGPVLPFIRSFLTIPMACSLLETYFSSTFEDVLHPACRHIHAFVFRASSVLDRKNPRPCSAALLASMLCVAAETGCDEMLTWSHKRRQSVSSKLYTLTVQLLKPLVHVDYGYPEASRQSSMFPPSGRQMTGLAEENAADDTSSFHEQGTIDDVVTYMHIAAVASASERKAASMRWWHAAFTLARELRLNLEPSTKLAMFQKGTESVPQSILASWTDWDAFDFGAVTMDLSSAAGESPPDPPSGREQHELGEEQQEERRRTWWLLYIQDRYLALCYNRHLALTDAECSELLLPLDEAAWQSGRFLTSTDPLADRPGLPSFTCTGHTVFGFLLPLMTIIGEIIDHNHGTQHPFLGEQYRMTPHAQAIEAQITRQLLTYKESLVTFQARQPWPLENSNTDSQQRALHTRTVVGYADFVIQICYILLAGKCDPVSMLEDKDFWMLSPEFSSTKDHAVKAAETLVQILDVDPDLSFMPYFMGILLLQGSFVLLLVIDRFQEQTEARTVSACETVIRATEACVATLDSEYQRKYRQILRSAVSQAQGRRVSEKVSRFRRRAVLALYRWTRSGTGLAL